MKKLLALLAAASLLLCGCALAESTGTQTVTPTSLINMDSYGTEECTVSANFETGTAIDKDGNFTYVARIPDVYDAAEIAALKAGDTVTVFEEDVKVEKVKEQNGRYIVNDGELTFYPMEDNASLMLCEDGSEETAYTPMGPYTFPLSNPVHLSTYSLDAEGNFIASEDGNGIQMDEQDLSPADARKFFVAHGDIDTAAYLSGDGSANTVTVKDGQVTRIVIDWSADN